jgi:hypothetical protein
MFRFFFYQFGNRGAFFFLFLPNKEAHGLQQ